MPDREIVIFNRIPTRASISQTVACQRYDIDPSHWAQVRVIHYRNDQLNIPLMRIMNAPDGTMPLRLAEDLSIVFSFITEHMDTLFARPDDSEYED